MAMNGRSSMLARRLAVAAGGIAVGLWGRRALRALEYLSSSEPFGGKTGGGPGSRLDARRRAWSSTGALAAVGAPGRSLLAC